VRALWVATLPETLTWADEEEFVDIGRHLAAGHGYVASSYRANPALPFYLGGVFAVFGESYLIARLGQCLMGALTCVVLLRLGTHLFGATAGLIAGLLLAVYPPHVYLSGVFYVECLFTLGMAISIWLAVRAVDSPRPAMTALACGAAGALTVLTRPVFAPVVPVIGVLWLLIAGPGWRRFLPAVAALALACALVIAPWTLRNYAVYGRVIPVSSGFFLTAWQGNNELASGQPDDRFVYWFNEHWPARLARLDAATRAAVEARYAAVDARARALYRVSGDWYLAADAALRPVVLDDLRHHPGRFARLAFTKVGTLFAAFSDTDSHVAVTASPYRLLAALAFYPLLLLAAAGALTVRAHRGVAVVYAAVGTMVLTYAALTACTRFRLPLDPYFILPAAALLAAAARTILSRWIPMRPAKGDRSIFAHNASGLPGSECAKIDLSPFAGRRSPR
jgi:4-amino-4-deoxy-L-arabinose transferase-like glycosyltransferase